MAKRILPRAAPARAVPKISPFQLELRSIRKRLEVASAIATMTAAALRAQNCDGDMEAALALQRGVGDELDLQCERLEQLAKTRGRGER